MEYQRTEKSKIHQNHVLPNRPSPFIFNSFTPMPNNVKENQEKTAKMTVKNNNESPATAGAPLKSKYVPPHMRQSQSARPVAAAAPAAGPATQSRAPLAGSPASGVAAGGSWSSRDDRYAYSLSFCSSASPPPAPRNARWSERPVEETDRPRGGAPFAARPSSGYDRGSRSGSSRYNQEYPLTRNSRMELELFGEHVNTGINFEKYEDIPVEASGGNIPEPIESVRF
jgi:ATP-dependent RNA helicase DDX3X